jgi:hypothetical protein
MLFYLFTFLVYWNRVSLYGPGWPWNRHPLASASSVLEFEDCATMPGKYISLSFHELVLSVSLSHYPSPLFPLPSPLFFMILGIEPRASCMLNKCSTTELHLQSLCKFIKGLSIVDFGICVRYLVTNPSQIPRGICISLFFFLFLGIEPRVYHWGTLPVPIFNFLLSASCS